MAVSALAVVERIAFAVFMLLLCGGQALYGLIAGAVWFGPRRYERQNDPSSFWTCVVFWIFCGAAGIRVAFG